MAQSRRLTALRTDLDRVRATFPRWRDRFVALLRQDARLFLALGAARAAMLASTLGPAFALVGLESADRSSHAALKSPTDVAALFLCLASSLVVGGGVACAGDAWIFARASAAASGEPFDAGAPRVVARRALQLAIVRLVLALPLVVAPLVLTGALTLFAGLFGPQHAGRAGIVSAIATWIATCAIEGRLLHAEFLVARGSGAREALRTSWEHTRAHALEHALLYLAVIALYVVGALGALCRGIGLVVTFPLVQAAVLAALATRHEMVRRPEAPGGVLDQPPRT